MDEQQQTGLEAEHAALLRQLLQRPCNISELLQLQSKLRCEAQPWPPDTG